MAHASLIFGLILPWICGYTWLAIIESRFAPGVGTNPARRAGYGFFLGYAILFIAIQINSAVAVQVSYLVVMISLALLTVIGGLLVRGQKQSRPPDAHSIIADFNHQNGVEKIFLVLISLWIVVHFLLAAVEVLSTPVYPWDAWLVWVYRAKAWFYSGGLGDFVSTREWISSASPALISIKALNYPEFASVIPFWAAVSLGTWSETLVNLPVLFCAIAIGLALYGQCRSAGLSLLPATAVCYLLFSTPLFGTHMALAGYADIWMAGFAGLGFVALIQGLSSGERMQLMLGVSMLAFSILVKNEAVVWFAAALVLLAVVMIRPLIMLATTTTFGLIAIIAVKTGSSFFEIPALGGAGLKDGVLIIPFVGQYVLETHNVWREYWANFFIMGSWHLAWTFVFAGLVLAAIRPPRQSSKAVFWFFLIFLSTQIFIFGFTDQGAWADQSTAINRLPLQFFPALLFAAALMFHERIQKPPGFSGPKHE